MAVAEGSDESGVSALEGHGGRRMYRCADSSNPEARVWREKSGELGGSELFADQLAVFPDDQGQAEALVLGVQLLGGAAMSSEGDLAFFRKFRHFLGNQRFVFPVDHGSSRNLSRS